MVVVLLLVVRRHSCCLEDGCWKRARHTCGSHVAGELRSGGGKVDLELLKLMLEQRDYPDTPIDGVTEPSFGFVGKGINSVLPLAWVELVEKLADVACAEHLVDIGELLGIIGREVRSKDAFRRAFAPQKLARRAGGTRRRYSCAHVQEEGRVRWSWISESRSNHGFFSFHRRA